MSSGRPDEATPVDPQAERGARRASRPPSEPVSLFVVAAIACGVIGLFTMQVLLSPATIVLAALGFNRTPTAVVPRRLAMGAYALGVVDGLLWLMFTTVFHLSGYPL